PPLDERIRRIAPRLGADARSRGVAGRAAGDSRRSAAAVAGTPGAMAAAGATAARGIPGAALLASVGAPRHEHVASASRLLGEIPDSVLATAHDPGAAPALLFALLLRPDADGRTRQKDAIVAHGGNELWSATTGLATAISGLASRARMPLLEVLLPALRELSPPQQRAVLVTARALTEGASAPGITDTAMMQLLHRQLSDDAGTTGSAPADGQRSLEILLSAVAWSGTADDAAARAAFDAGAGELRPIAVGLDLQPRSALDGRGVLEAMRRLHGAPLPLRRRVLEACILAVAHDGRVEAAEADLLRTVAEAIELPLPIPN
ncbi:MAG TPA: hypothetical protein VK936_14670, partial [Longimicrobiales bacterium]|nr:hypothetical protein [Longimicrobiales bacterium]